MQIRKSKQPKIQQNNYPGSVASYNTRLILQRPRAHTGQQRQGWRRGIVVSGVRRTNKVNPRRARLVTREVTVSEWVYHLA